MLVVTQRPAHIHSQTHTDTQSRAHTPQAHTCTCVDVNPVTITITVAHSHAQKATHTVTVLHPESHTHTHTITHSHIHIRSSMVCTQSLCPPLPWTLTSPLLQPGLHTVPLESGCPCPVGQLLGGHDQGSSPRHGGFLWREPLDSTPPPRQELSRSGGGRTHGVLQQAREKPLSSSALSPAARLFPSCLSTAHRGPGALP